EAALEAVAVACQEFATEAEPETPPVRDKVVGIGRRVRSLRFDQLVAVMARQFDCEVRPGKGSEVVFYRPGGKSYALGHHKQNHPVPAVQVLRMLKRLGLPVRDGLAAASQ